MDFENLDWIEVENAYPDVGEFVIVKCESLLIKELYAYDTGVWDGSSWINYDGRERPNVVEWAYPTEEFIRIHEDFRRAKAMGSGEKHDKD